MSKKEKLLKRLLSRPMDFTFDELTVLLVTLGFKFANSGRTSGSACRFEYQDGTCIYLHKPHPGSVLEIYQISEIIRILKEMELI